jgi:4-hydroxybenzoate polyprenyltransferase
MDTALSIKLGAISDVIRLKKQYGTLLLLCPTLWSLFIAGGGAPSAKHVAIFIIGSFLMRSAGCVMNDMADVRFDRLVERTRTRPLANGRLTRKEAAFVFVALVALAFMLVLLLNALTIWLSFVGLGLAAIYPFIKRVSHLPQAFLGMAFGWGAVMAWSAETGEVGAPAILIFSANVAWAMSYDTIYALMDMKDDLKAGVKSTAILFGKKVFSAIFLLNAAMVALLAVAGLVARLGVLYYLGLASAFVFLALILAGVKKGGSQSAAMNGFVANAAVGGFILAAIMADLHF